MPVRPSPPDRAAWLGAGVTGSASEALLDFAGERCDRSPESIFFMNVGAFASFKIPIPVRFSLSQYHCTSSCLDPLSVCVCASQARG